MGEPTESKKTAPLPLPEYYEATRGQGASKSLVEALTQVSGRDEALDLGSGSGRDSLFLVEQGFGHVVAVDQEPAARGVLDYLPPERADQLEFVQSSFSEYDFGVERFDIVNAQFALPFNPPETFGKMYDQLKQSLKPGGVFVGTFFGENDEWNTPGSKRTFHSRSDVEALLVGFEIITFNEEDNQDGRLADGTPKHWHRFIVIARKPLGGASA